MRHRKVKWIVAFLCVALLQAHIYTKRASAQEQRSVREPILAGTWYPGDREALRKAIDVLLSRAEGSALQGELEGLVVPHAGYIYSGQVAAHAYRLLKRADYRRVILIGPSHRMEFKGVSMDLHSGYKTPLGVLPVDRAFGKKLLESDPFVASIPQAHEREHSLEIQIPFLQIVLPDARVVPLIMGQQDLASCERLASLLIRVIGPDRKTLILASSDLSHFHGDARARSMDGEFIRQFRSYEPMGLAGSIAQGMSEACGAGPVIAAMLACRGLGANRAIRLGYATSGDVTGDRNRVVGYLAAALLKGDE